MLVKDAHLVARERTQLGKSGQLKRIQAEVNSTGDGNVDIAGLERGTSVGNCQQAGGAGGIYHVASSLEVEIVADPPGNRIGKPAGQRLFRGRRERRFVELLDFLKELVQFAVETGRMFLQRCCKNTTDVRPAQAEKVCAGKL